MGVPCHPHAAVAPLSTDASTLVDLLLNPSAVLLVLDLQYISTGGEYPAARTAERPTSTFGSPANEVPTARSSLSQQCFSTRSSTTQNVDNRVSTSPTMSIAPRTSPTVNPCHQLSQAHSKHSKHFGFHGQSQLLTTIATADESVQPNNSIVAGQAWLRVFACGL